MQTTCLNCYSKKFEQNLHLAVYNTFVFVLQKRTSNHSHGRKRAKVSGSLSLI